MIEPWGVPTTWTLFIPEISMNPAFRLFLKRSINIWDFIVELTLLMSIL
jgi:hypothetical protein